VKSLFATSGELIGIMNECGCCPIRLPLAAASPPILRKSRRRISDAQKTAFDHVTARIA
jgi:hypothetical protein